MSFVNKYITIQNYLNAQFGDECAEQLKYQISIQISTQETERERIARDLHDGVGAYLLGASLILSTIDDRKPEIEEALSLITLCHQQIRSISHNLSNIKIGEIPFNQLIENFFQRLSQTTNIVLEIKIDSCATFVNVNRETQTSIYRIIQELTSNIIRHSKAQNMLVIITSTQEWLELEISDNGIGFDLKSNVIGVGLSNVIMRIKALDGQIQILSEPSKGTNVRIKLPLKDGNNIFN